MSTLYCSQCQCRILGRYTKWEDGTTACSSCVASYPRCLRCGKLTSNPNAKMCYTCQANSPRCQVCRGVLIDRYVKIPPSTIMCLPCNEMLPKCNRCSVPFVNGIAHNGKRYCQTCFQQGIRCRLCDDICSGQYWQHPKIGHFCNGCKSSVPGCSWCGVPTISPRTLQDHKKKLQLCGDCFSQAQTCHLCNLVLTGRYFAHPNAPERKFCSSCMRQAERCARG